MSGKSVAELANNDKFKTVNGDSFTPIEVVTVLSIAVGLWQVCFVFKCVIDYTSLVSVHFLIVVIIVKHF